MSGLTQIACTQTFEIRTLSHSDTSPYGFLFIVKDLLVNILK